MRLEMPLAAALFTCAFGFAGCSSDDAADPVVESGEPHAGGGIEPGIDLPGTGTLAAYPDGPYGNSVGAVVQNFKFTGFVNPLASGYVADANTITTISLADYYNPDGDPSRPVALMVNASALWCSVCQQEAKLSMNHYGHWKPKGVEFVTSIFEDNDSNPATLVDIEYWAKKYQLEYPVVLDPALKLGVFFDKSASPFNMIIDTRTMRIEFAEAGLIDLGPDNETLQRLAGE